MTVKNLVLRKDKDENQKKHSVFHVVDQNKQKNFKDVLDYKGEEIKKPVFGKDIQEYLGKNKSEILGIIGLSPKDRQIQKENKEEQLKSKPNISGERLDNINKLNKRLKDIFDQNTKDDFHKNYNQLPDVNTTFIKNGKYKALIKSVTDKGVYVYMFKGGPEFFINEKNLIVSLKKIDSDDYFLRGDMIDVELEKTEKDIKLVQTDNRFEKIKKLGIWNENIAYFSKSSGKMIKGKIIALSRDNKKEEVIFEQENGNIFSVKLQKVLEGIVNKNVSLKEDLRLVS